jgi:hypothetical protein
MSGKSAKRIRKQVNKLNKEVFKDFMVEVSAMPFWTRLAFCLNMAFCRHALQRGLMPEIKARRKYNREGQQIKPVHRSFRLTRKAVA